MNIKDLSIVASDNYFGYLGTALCNFLIEFVIFLFNQAFHIVSFIKVTEKNNIFCDFLLLKLNLFDQQYFIDDFHKAFFRQYTHSYLGFTIHRYEQQCRKSCNSYILSQLFFLVCVNFINYYFP